MRDRVAALSGNRHAGAQQPVAGDGGIDPAALGAQSSPDDGIVLALYLSAQEFRHEMAVGGRAAGHYEEARRVLVEAMYHAGSGQAASSG